MAWDFFVNHYADAEQQAKDPKLGPHGIFYPRAGTLGGCTAHNAMIFVCPQDADWNAIARDTNDPSWSAAHMRRLLRKLEDCHHRPFWRLARRLGIDPTGHGWRGWLRSEHVKPREIVRDNALLRLVIDSAWRALSGPKLLDRLWRLFVTQADPNSRLVLRRALEGVFYTPLTTRNHRRVGTRERLCEVRQDHSNLHIELHALATRIVIEQGRAAGVAFLRGERLYRAHPSPSTDPGTPDSLRARHGVIVCGGAFNTPQLLMLSGIGPPAELQRHGIAVQHALEGVGRNLQDRYEIAVVNRMAHDWRALAGARFAAGDPLYREWARGLPGMYASNGAALAVARRSKPGLPQPDLFCMPLLAQFSGYYPGYAEDIRRRQDCLSWVVLKAHTANRAGTVRLRSADPRDMPLVDFNSFDATDDPNGADLAAVVEGIRFVRQLAAPLARAGIIAAEELPGPAIQDADLAAYVRNNAWGHHASCSCPIGAIDRGGVLTSDFRVHGIDGLRVVDASVFPRIPGFFIASAIYLIAEKAAGIVAREFRAA